MTKSCFKCNGTGEMTAITVIAEDPYFIHSSTFTCVYCRGEGKLSRYRKVTSKYDEKFLKSCGVKWC